MHLENLADALLPALGRVDHLGTGIKMTGVDTHVGQATKKRMHRNLEGKRGEGLVSLCATFDEPVFLAGILPLHSWHVKRRREKVDYPIEHRLHAAVFEC